MIDRAVQKTETFSGIDGVNAQDVCRAGKHGLRRGSHPREPQPHRHGHHLRPPPAIAGNRTVAEGGVPPGAGDNYYMLRPAQAILPVGVDWRDALWNDLYPDGSHQRNGK